jgi:hypothetical protein
LQDAFEDEAKGIAFAEAAMPRLGEAGAVGNLARQAKAAKPAISQIEVNFLERGGCASCRLWLIN